MGNIVAKGDGETWSLSAKHRSQNNPVFIRSGRDISTKLKKKKYKCQTSNDFLYNYRKRFL